MAWRFHLCVVLSLCLALPAGAEQQDVLDQAKVLYGSAAYDDALAMLERLQAGSVEGAGIEVALYRMFCLLVLDRTTEAQAVIEEIVSADPFFLPADTQASPRIRAIFVERRAALLPSAARRMYSEARAAYVRKDQGVAEQFDRVIRLLDDPALQSDSTLSELRVLATEFRDVSAAVADLAAARGPAPSRSGPATDADPDVEPPIVLSQQMPQWSPVGPDAKREFSGEVEVMIDERGSVVSVSVRDAIHPVYDNLVVKQAAGWKYRPATRAGVPVRFLKTIRIQLRPPA